MASDSDGDEDFVSYGTPLEPLEEDEPRKKPVPLHEQTVKDEKGRFQRFHGAFTGGFSAGYYNTVGSKEGWAPATFVSSRQQKAEKQLARPEDFMDDEDLGEHGIAPAQITTSQEFSSSRRDEAREKARAVNAQAALIPGDTLLEELIAPARSSIGVELLRKMGWKEGQGVGPRVKRKARRQQTGVGARVYSSTMPPAGSEDSEDDDDDDDFAPEDVTFAPKDVTPVDFSPRSGVRGLGYRGLDPGMALLGRAAPEHIDLFKPQSETRSRLFGAAQRGSRRGGGVAGQAFGVGALEDEDEDVYHKDSMSRYDTELGGEEPGDGLYGWTAPQQYTKRRDKSKDASYLGKILEGFTLTQRAGEEKTIFPPPTLPRDYRPVHRFHLTSVSVSRLSGVSPALAEALRTSRGHMVKEDPQQGGRHQLDSGQRRALLGEDVLQGPSSVMELLKPEDRDRLLNLRNSSNATDSRHATSSGGSTAGSTAGTMAGSMAENAARSSAVSLAVTSAVAMARSMAGSMAGSSSVSSALSGAASSSGLHQQQQEALASWRGVQSSTQSFKPFEKNPSKQARYELYLDHLRQGDRDAVEQSLDSGMTEWERSREREEFVRASILYRPSSSSLTARFTSAKHDEDDGDTVEVSRDQEGDVDDKQAAVKMKMFGKLTRETFEWHPDKLLCKRFNVPDPFPGSGLVGMPKVKRDKFSVFNFLTVTESRETTAPPKPPETGKRSRWDISDQKKKIKEEEEGDASLPACSSSEQQTADGTKSVDQKSSDKKSNGDEEEEEDEEESRPPMDLFKAIFASSSDEKSSSSEGESEEEEKTKEDEGKVEPQALNLFNISSSVTSSSTSVTVSTCANQQTVKAPVSSRTSSQEEFGPKLPPPSAALGECSTSRPPPSEERPDNKRSREKKHKNKKQHKHKKDKKKKKHKKHKHKAKQQKKSKTEASDSSEDEEDGHVSTEELLKRLKSVQSRETW
ncbi:G patch domain-containing protein 1 isoform X1 [Scophthalmus maximus]|uniref:G patch domain-containing protein 1 isoform X1 n=1 Tax=Scophthalmus maximus TaxID=52904 RepID=UPI001FA82CDE|nr:G patch domain-containing protein 1 isoform X1 [Scophthalmus maximus]